jgi:hypothetical protein
MSSLVDRTELVGFFSYSREDDDDSEGALSRLRDRIQRELSSQLGRSREDFRLWQDKAAIPHGALWENEITSAIAQSVFFIPIVTPRAIKSRHCAFEFQSFLKREMELGRDDLVFPILYIRIPELENESRWRKDPVLAIVGTRQYLDWRDLRHHDFGSIDVRVKVEHFCRNVAKAVRKPWASPEEPRTYEERAPQEAEEEPQRKAPDAERGRAEKLHRQQEPAPWCVEPERPDEPRKAPPWQALVGWAIGAVAVATLISMWQPEEVWMRPWDVIEQLPRGWNFVPTITVVSAAGDLRLPMVRDAVTFWNNTFSELGSGFRLGALTQVVGSIPVEDLQKISLVTNLPGLPESLKRIDGNVVVALSEHEFLSFTARRPALNKAVVAIKDYHSAPLTLPNVARNVIAQLLGYAIGLSPNADPTTLMCGRPARCPPALFASDRPKYFPLTEAEKVDLRRMYPPGWQASRS